MPLMIEHLRRAFATQLAVDAHHCIDQALAHVLSQAYAAGLADARRPDEPLTREPNSKAVAMMECGENPWL